MTETDKEKLLEKHLVKIYDLYFDIEYKFDETAFLTLINRNFLSVYTGQCSFSNSMGYMSGKSEKDKRKEILRRLKAKEKEHF